MPDIKYFNKGVVRGIVLKATFRNTKVNKRPYVDLQIQCSTPAQGKFRAFGRLWGPETVKHFKDDYSRKPHKPFEFTGMYTQYKKDGLKSNYQFFSYSIQETVEARATFILTGIMGTINIDDREIILRYENKGKTNLYELKVSAEIRLDNFKRGDYISAYGHITDDTAHWGGDTHTLSPLVERMDFRGAGENADEEESF